MSGSQPWRVAAGGFSQESQSAQRFASGAPSTNAQLHGCAEAPAAFERRRARRRGLYEFPMGSRMNEPQSDDPAAYDAAHPLRGVAQRAVRRLAGRARLRKALRHWTATAAGFTRPFESLARARENREA